MAQRGSSPNGMGAAVGFSIWLSIIVGGIMLHEHPHAFEHLFGNGK